MNLRQGLIIGAVAMLIVVGFSMLMILGGTYLGKFLQDPHTAAAA